jgi:hypothetical protein
MWVGYYYYFFVFVKAHDGGVVAVELSRVMGSAPQLITIGADKTLAIWDTVTFKVLILDICMKLYYYFLFHVKLTVSHLLCRK